MTSAPAYALFPTPIGTCGIRWGRAAVTGFSLPSDDDDYPAIVRRRWPGAAETIAPEWIRDVQRDVVRLLTGEPVDLRDVPVDFGDAPRFQLLVYEATRRIPPGSVATYGEIARQTGAPRGAQAVGYALGKNPVPLIVPCHRIIAVGGDLRGFSAPGGVVTKQRLLHIEGALRPPQPDLFDADT